MTSKMQLSVIVLFVALLSVAFAIDCGIHGREESGICVCQSGYGGELGLCEENALESCPLTILSSDHSGNGPEQVANYPDLDLTRKNFTAQILELSLLGHVVANRTYSNISFVGQSDSKCSIGGGSHWKLAADADACRDRFALSMPWSHHVACGFKKTASAGLNHEYKATILVTYVDQLGEVYEGAGIFLTRRSSVSYDVYIRFPKRLEVRVDTVTVNSVINLKVAITAFEYDPEEQQITIGVTTFVAWPNMILGSTRSEEFAPVITSDKNYPISGVVITPHDCGMATPNASDVGTGPVGRACRQFISFVMPLTESCSFDGEYTVKVMVSTCRESPYQCTNAWMEAAFDINHSNVCQNVTASPLVTGELVAYVDEEHTEESTNFLAGAEGYFGVVMDAVNDLNLTFIDIWVIAVPDDQDLTPEPIYFYRNGAVVTTNAQGEEENNYDNREGPVGLVVSELAVNDEVTGGVVRSPSFKFFFDNNVFGIEPRMTRTFILHATGKITYLGNERYGKRAEESARKVDLKWEVKTGDLESKVMFDVAVNKNQAVAAPAASSAKDLAVALAPVLGMALAAIAAAVVVAVVIVKRRNTSGYTAFSN